MKYTLEHNGVYYWIVGSESDVNRLKTVLQSFVYDSISDWMYDHVNPMSKWVVIKMF